MSIEAPPTICPACSQPLRAGARFCHVCGQDSAAWAQAAPAAVSVADRKCPACKTANTARAAFCRKCGRPLPVPAPPPVNAQTPSFAAAQSLVATQQGGGGSAATQVASTLGAATGLQSSLMLPWQTITTGQAPDIRSLIATGSPLVQRALGASLRQPALALIATTVLSLLVARLADQPMPWLPVIMGVTTAGLALAASRGSAQMRQLSGVAALATGGVQAGFIIYTLSANSGSSGNVISAVAAQASSLLMLGTMAVSTLRRRP